MRERVGVRQVLKSAHALPWDTRWIEPLLTELASIHTAPRGLESHLFSSLSLPPMLP